MVRRAFEFRSEALSDGIRKLFGRSEVCSCPLRLLSRGARPTRRALEGLSGAHSGPNAAARFQPVEDSAPDDRAASAPPERGAQLDRIRHRVRVVRRRHVSLAARVRPYVLAAIGVAAATAIRLPFEGLLHGRAPYGLYYVAILLTAWLGGVGPTLLAIGLSLASARAFFVPVTEQGSGASLLLFLSVAGTMLWLARAARGLHDVAENAL